MAERVRITDVSPRDGLQNEPGVIPTIDKVTLVELLCQTGVDEIEVTSFVSPKWVPQLADAADVLAGTAAVLAKLSSAGPDDISVLIPNLKGLETLDEVDGRIVGQYDMEQLVPPLVSKIALFTAASETFSRKNTNAGIAETLERFRELLRSSSVHRRIRGYISCAIACPFEGQIHPGTVADVAAALVDLGVTEIDVADTIGAGTPDTVNAMLETVARRIGSGWLERRALTLHLHDTFGRAADCVKAALDLGVRSFDGSVAGLGGCPYASTKLPDGTIQRAPGNISTELLVRTVHEAGYETGVDLDALARAAEFARSIVAKSRAEAAS
jgi:hydroxymethylglutaryl-CoA lyase